MALRESVPVHDAGIETAIYELPYTYAASEHDRPSCGCPTWHSGTSKFPNLLPIQLNDLYTQRERRQLTDKLQDVHNSQNSGSTGTAAAAAAQQTLHACI